MQEPGTPQSQQPIQPSYNTPIPEPSGYIPQAVSSGVNDSGTGAGAVLPAELKYFNWGSFFWTWIWSIGHQFWLGLLALPLGFVIGLIPLIGPVAGIAISVVFGIKGNEWAWQHRRWDSTEHFRKTQRVWGMWALGFFILILILLLFAVLLPILLGARPTTG
jgi:hypothetical protein